MPLWVKIGLTIVVGIVAIWVVASLIMKLLWYLIIGALVVAAIGYGYRKVTGSLPAAKWRERLNRGS